MKKKKDALDSQGTESTQTDKGTKKKEKSFIQVVKETSIPTQKQWWHSYWRVVIITVAIAVLLIAADYGFSQATLFAQSSMPAINLGKTGVNIYIGALFLMGILTAAGVLIQQGTTDGLTSMFGSNIQYSSSMSAMTKKISKITLFFGIAFTILCLVSPIVLGGSFSS